MDGKWWNGYRKHGFLFSTACIVEIHLQPLTLTEKEHDYEQPWNEWHETNTDEDRKTQHKSAVSAAAPLQLMRLGALLDENNDHWPANNGLAEIIKHAFIKEKSILLLYHIYLHTLPPCLDTIEAETERYNGQNPSYNSIINWQSFILV